MTQADYDRGFADAIKFTVRCIRNSADSVEAKQAHFAAKLRDYADAIEHAHREITYEAPHGTSQD